jgi:hypothetical protein
MKIDWEKVAHTLKDRWTQDIISIYVSKGMNRPQAKIHAEQAIGYLFETTKRICSIEENDPTP